MRRLLFVWCILLGVHSNASANDVHFRISFKGSYTTSTRFIYNIDHPALFDQERILTSNLGYGADVEWKIMWDRFYLGVSYETIAGKEESFLYFSNSDVRVPTAEGFDLKLIEISGYYIVPISSDEIQFYMGGGFGLYDGNRNSSIAGVKPATIESSNNIGIHVLTGVIYSFTNSIGVRGELKFRDPHFDVTEKYEQPFVDYSGVHVFLNQSPMKTRVNLYGINYMVGLVYQF